MVDIISSSKLEEDKALLVAELRWIADKIEKEPNSGMLGWNIEYGLHERVRDDNSIHRCYNGQSRWDFTVYIPSDDHRATRKECNDN